MRKIYYSIIFSSCLALGVACGGNGDGGNGNGDGGISFDGGDGGAGGSGGGVGGNCIADGGPECNDCVDNDGDGLIDGLDFHCTGGADNDESSFATGIAGDNVDIKNQDCYFDGNSGAGNDGCDFGHGCCLVPDGVAFECPDKSFKPQNCEPIVIAPDSQCALTCGPASPPGCDCNGCCTVCDGTTCADVALAFSPNCNEGNLNDPAVCVPCNKVAGCGGGECDNSNCILCPGQTVDDLPPECSMTNSCPGGLQACTTTSDCADPNTSFCQAGCCVAVVQ